MTEYAVTVMEQKATELEEFALKLLGGAAAHRKAAQTAEDRAQRCKERAAELRAAITRVATPAVPMTLDDIARMMTEGLVEPSPSIDVRYWQPDGDSYGRDFIEPHIG